MSLSPDYSRINLYSASETSYDQEHLHNAIVQNKINQMKYIMQRRNLFIFLGWVRFQLIVRSWSIDIVNV